MKKVSLRDKPIILVLICGSISVIFALLTLFTDFENEEIEQNWDYLFYSVSIASIGIALFTLRQFRIYKEFFDSLELLIFLVVPTIALIPILSEPKINLIIFAPVYIGSVLGWFLLVKIYLVKSMVEGKEKKYTQANVNAMWSMLMVFGAMFIGIFIFVIVPIFVNTPE